MFKAVYYKLDAKNAFKRNYNLILLLRKIISTCVIVYAYEDPVSVLIIFFVLSIIFFIINLGAKPYFGRDYNYLSSVLEIINMFIYGFFIGYVSEFYNDSASVESKKGWGKLNTCVLFLPLLIFTLFIIWNFRKIYFERKNLL